MPESPFPVAELLTALAILAGWMLLTAGIAALLPVWRGPVWMLSAGLLLLSGVGWRFLWLLVRDGLYTRSRGK
jgi:hypothetical protein